MALGRAWALQVCRTGTPGTLRPARPLAAGLMTGLGALNDFQSLTLVPEFASNPVLWICDFGRFHSEGRLHAWASRAVDDKQTCSVVQEKATSCAAWLLVQAAAEHDGWCICLYSSIKIITYGGIGGCLVMVMRSTTC